MKGAKKEGRKEGIINLYFKNRLKISWNKSLIRKYKSIKIS
jgi:hypothetical protein